MSCCCGLSTTHKMPGCPCICMYKMALKKPFSGSSQIALKLCIFLLILFCVFGVYLCICGVYLCICGVYLCMCGVYLCTFFIPVYVWCVPVYVLYTCVCVVCMFLYLCMWCILVFGSVPVNLLNESAF